MRALATFRDDPATPGGAVVRRDGTDDDLVFSVAVPAWYGGRPDSGREWIKFYAGLAEREVRPESDTLMGEVFDLASNYPSGMRRWSDWVKTHDQYPDWLIGKVQHAVGEFLSGHLTKDDLQERVLRWAAM